MSTQNRTGTFFISWSLGMKVSLPRLLAVHVLPLWRSLMIEGYTKEVTCVDQVSVLTPHDQPNCGKMHNLVQPTGQSSVHQQEASMNNGTAVV